MYNAAECDHCKKVARAGNIPLPNALIGLPEPLAPQGWITAFTKGDNKYHFCSFDCLAIWAERKTGHKCQDHKAFLMSED